MGDEDSDDEPVKPTKTAVGKKQIRKPSSASKNNRKASSASKKVETTKPKAKPAPKKVVEESSEDDSEDDAMDEEPVKPKAVEKPPVSKASNANKAKPQVKVPAKKQESSDERMIVMKRRRLP